MTRLTLVSNRLPWTVKVSEGGETLMPSAGGLATALAGPHAADDSSWVGWPGSLEGLDTGARQRVLEALHQKRLTPVELSLEDVTRYYEGFSNGVLWPLCHYLLDKVSLDADLDWEAYQSVNERFAATVAELAASGALVWVHDYQLMLVPRMLRELRPDVRIGFFLHIPFPAHEVFRILPWAEQLLQGMLASDLLGFHTEDYRNHFATCACQMLGARPTEGGLSYEDRDVRLAEYAIGIDVGTFVSMAQTPGVEARCQQLREEVGGRRILLGVDRLDYTKGIPRRLMAFERFLEENPGLRDRVLLLQAAVPSREGVEAYAAFRRQVDEIAARINGRFGTPGVLPVHLLHQAFPLEELVALYRAADVMLVTPLRDGMNLVAKEFCACRIDDTGVLVLSEFAGAAVTMKEALLVNPYDVGSLAQAIRRALDLPPQQASRRMRSLRHRVERSNVHQWARRFLGDLEAVGPLSPAGPWPVLLERIQDEAASSERTVILLDYDGTLVPLAPTPEAAAPDLELKSLLRDLASLPGVEVHVVSGRPREVLEAWLGELPLALHAEHGLWLRASGTAEWVAVRTVSPLADGPLAELLGGWVRAFEGSFIEWKTASVAWHYRRVPGGLRLPQLRTLQAQARELSEGLGLEMLEGSRVLEFRPRGVQKGLALSADMGGEGVYVLAIGDDRTDEDLFRALPVSACSIRVGQGPSEARYRLPDPASVRRLLRGFLASSMAGEARP
nr:bifunctional alpha,alpha-trehalose-phosphate synthase (UDP-forming)/trehalose-phosphatase [uncultured Holophaga sp.]